MDYPNLLDRLNYLKGDGIWLHGTDKLLAPNTTNGCIALENKDVVELSQYLRLRRTPIIIEEKVRYTDPQKLQEERDRIRQILQEWQRAWETKQLDLYMSFYSLKFRSKAMDWKAWKAHKDRLNRQYRTIKVDLGQPFILKHSENIVTVFFQSYRSDRFSNEGTKRLYFTPEGSSWKIIGEEWDQRRGGETPPPIPEATLVAFLSPKMKPEKAAPASAPAPGATTAVAAQPEKPDFSARILEIQAFLDTWKESWEAKDLDRFMNCYSKTFRAQGKGWEQWRQNKKTLYARYQRIQVTLRDVKIEPQSNQAVVSFRQIYRSDGLESAGQKNLTLRQEEAAWKIIRENFSRSKARR